MDIAKIETFESNKGWLKSLRNFDGTYAFSEDDINKMTEEKATEIAKSIMEE